MRNQEEHWVIHPLINSFSRNLTEGLFKNGKLGKLYTTIGSSGNGSRQRQVNVPQNKISRTQACEWLRIVLGRLGLRFREAHVLSVDSAYHRVGRLAVNDIRHGARPSVIHAYEDGALEVFKESKKHGAICVYHLPILYWKKTKTILEKAAEKRPEWKQTIETLSDSANKLYRKDIELQLSDVVVCPSNIVAESLPEEIKCSKRVVVAPWGYPTINPPENSDASPSARLRLLFIGGLSQRKGLADLLDAVRASQNICELTVMGGKFMSQSFYSSKCPGLRLLAPASQKSVFHEMRQADIFVLPSLVEGRALVLQEAMANGLPVITTDAGGLDGDLKPWENGWRVPSEDPYALASMLAEISEKKVMLPNISKKALHTARKWNWADYVMRITENIY